jgi:hypothetical protein
MTTRTELAQYADIVKYCARTVVDAIEELGHEAGVFGEPVYAALSSEPIQVMYPTLAVYGRHAEQASRATKSIYLSSSALESGIAAATA